MQRARRQPERATVVCFVRHGTTPTTGKVLPGRARGLHLSEAGRAEAVDTAGRFDGVPVTAVYASPLERGRETAAPIGERAGLPVVVDKALVECDFGEWTGAELAKLSKLPEWRTVQQWPSGWRFPGGESFAELQVRLEGAIDRYRAEHPGGIVVAVSHADCIKAALALALGVPLDLFQRIMVGPCSTSAVAYTAAGPLVLAVNSYGSIRGLVPPKGASRDGAAAAARGARRRQGAAR